MSSWDELNCCYGFTCWNRQPKAEVSILRSEHVHVLLPRIHRFSSKTPRWTKRGGKSMCVNNHNNAAAAAAAAIRSSLRYLLPSSTYLSISSWPSRFFPLVPFHLHFFLSLAFFFFFSHVHSINPFWHALICYHSQSYVRARSLAAPACLAVFIKKK